ncbi:S-layer homology domain protein [anaerobic digester metagenome]
MDRETAAENAAALRLIGGNLSIIDGGTLWASCNKYPSGGTSYGILATQGSGGNGGEVTVSDVATMNVSLGYVGISASQSVTLNASAKVTIDVNNCGIDTPALTVNRAFLDVCASGSGGKPFKETTLLTLDHSYLAAARISADTYIYEPEELEAIEYDASRDVFAYGGNRVRGFVFYPVYEGDQYMDCLDWDWATLGNYFVIENGIMGSVYTNSKYFDSNGSVTRGMMVTVLYRLAGSPALTEGDYTAYNGKFSDVAKGQWYYDAVVWANKNNVTTGVTDTSFAPNGKVTREQLVTFFFRFGYLYHDDPDVGATLSKYKDLDQIASYALPAFRWAYGHGIVNGTSSTTLSPKATCTRGQMAKIITVFSGVYLGDRDWIRIAGQ